MHALEPRVHTPPKGSCVWNWVKDKRDTTRFSDVLQTRVTDKVLVQTKLSIQSEGYDCFCCRKRDQTNLRIIL